MPRPVSETCSWISPSARRAGEGDHAAGRGLAQRVLDQVVEDLAQAPGVAADQADVVGALDDDA